MSTTVYITRMDYPKAVGWWVRHPFGQKFFPDKRHGGKRKAKKEAIAFRDSLGEARPKPFQTKLSSRNRHSKRIGVCPVIRKGVRYGWKAYWSMEKQQVVETYLFSEYGKRGARQLAVSRRQVAELAV